MKAHDVLHHAATLLSRLLEGAGIHDAVWTLYQADEFSVTAAWLSHGLQRNIQIWVQEPASHRTAILGHIWMDRDGQRRAAALTGPVGTVRSLGDIRDLTEPLRHFLAIVEVATLDGAPATPLYPPGGPPR